MALPCLLSILHSKVLYLVPGSVHLVVVFMTTELVSFYLFTIEKSVRTLGVLDIDG